MLSKKTTVQMRVAEMAGNFCLSCPNLKVDKLDVNGKDAVSFPTTPLHLACKVGRCRLTISNPN